LLFYEGKNKPMSERDLVKECLLEIFRISGYESLSGLTQRDYEHISHEIEAKTSTLISVSTLKRLLNGEFSRIPQTATLNAISSYIGYKTWYEYKNARKQSNATTTENNEAGIKSDPRTHKLPFSRIKQITAISVGAVSVVVAILFIRYAPGNTPGNFDKASFSAEKTTSNEIPNTVIFHYNVDDVQADSFFIQQSWDVSRRVRVFKNNYTLTDIYYEPGYHMAKLIANDSIIKFVDVSIPTDGWFLFAKDVNPSSIPQYIKPTLPLVQNGVLRLSKTDLVANQIDFSKEKRYIYTLFPADLRVNSDNYVLKARVRITEVRNNFCPTLMVEAMTQRYFNFFQSTSKGCASEAMAGFGENFISGKNADLSPIAYDLTEWADVELKVENRNASISFNGKPVYRASYHKPSGLITGVTFISNGLAEIDFVELKGLDGTVVYENDFSEPGL